MSSGTYVSVKPTPSSAVLIEDRFNWINPQKASKRSSYHVTLIYSDKKLIPEAENFVNPDTHYSAFITGIDWFLGHDKAGYLVANVSSIELNERHRFWVAMGGKHSYPDYKPHLTLATGVSRSDWNAIQSSVLRITQRLPILLTNERAEPIVRDWKASTKA